MLLDSFVYRVYWFTIDTYVFYVILFIFFFILNLCIVSISYDLEGYLNTMKKVKSFLSNLFILFYFLFVCLNFMQFHFFFSIIKFCKSYQMSK